MACPRWSRRLAIVRLNSNSAANVSSHDPLVPSGSGNEQPPAQHAGASARASAMIPTKMATKPLPAGATNLPMALTPLIGRGRELESIGEIMGRSRLATVTGPGGVGKTRLALELARRQIGRRGDGVWLVDLTATPRPENVADEVARVLGVRPMSGTTSSDALRRFLADRDLLLIVDNCEHVILASAELAAALLGGCRRDLARRARATHR